MHKIAGFAIVTAVVYTVALAFQIFVVSDEAQPAGTSTAFAVERIDTATKDDALAVLATAATELGGNVFKVQPDPADSYSGRVLYAFVGDSATFEVHGGFDYPSFAGQSQETRVASADDITTEDLRGRYVTSLEAARMPELLALLEDGGVVASEDTTSALEVALLAMGQSNFAGTLVVTFAALLLAVSYSVAQHRRVYALRALHGYRRVVNLGSELAAAGRVFALGVGGALVVGLPLLAWACDRVQATRFLGLLAVALSVLALVLAATVTSAVLVLDNGRIPQVIKGERAALRVGALAAVVQVVVLAVTVATMTAAMNRIEAVDESLHSSDAWTAGGDLFALRLATTGTHEDDVRDAPGLTSAIADLEQRDQVVLVAYDDYSVASDAGAVGEPGGSSAMIVNDEYLRRQPVRDSDGRTVRGSTGGLNEFTLLVPASYQGDVESLLSSYEEYFEENCSLGRADTSFACEPVGTVERTAPGQAWFAYGQTSYLPVELQGVTELVDPVVAVVSAESRLISPLSYLSYVSKDDVLFSDAGALDQALEKEGIRGSFQGIDNAADAVTTSVALAQRELRMDAFSLAFGLVVLLSSSVILVMVYCDRRQRAMFVELLHGYGFSGRHWRYLAGSLGLACTGVAIAAVVGNSLSSGRDVLLAAGLVAAQGVVAGVAVTVYESRFRADFIKRD